VKGQGKLHLGLIPSGEAPAPVAFAAALGRALGTAVELHKAVDYRALVSAMEQGYVDFAWLPPLSAARVVRSGAGVPAAIAVRNGTTSYMAGLLALASSKVKHLGDLVGVRAAWVDRESASGYVVIRHALRQSGLSLVDAFAEELFVRSHAEVARALQTGQVDVGATCFNMTGGTVHIARLPPGTALSGGPGAKPSAVEGLASAEVRILAQAGPIPSDIFALRAAVAPAAMGVVAEALVDARPADAHAAAKEMMLADGFMRPSRAHEAMIEGLFAILDAPPSRR
jgi:phosphonate transport system substrate-binding protein